MEGLSELIRVELKVPENIANGYEYVGRIAGVDTHFRTFIVLKKDTKHFLNIFNGTAQLTTNPDYYIEFNNVDQLQSIIERYNQEKQAVGFGQGANIFEVMASQRLGTNDFTPPELAKDDEQGWHRIDDQAYSDQCDIDDIAQVENDAIFFDGTHNAFIKQMTAFNATSPVSIIETAHSDGFIVFIHNQSGALVTLFYFQGENKQDIPVDMQACIDRYGRFTIRMINDEN